MSSKSAENTTGPIDKSNSPRWSITRRLTLLYTLSAFGMLVIATVFLYWVLTNNLEKEDNQFLANKIHVLRVILRERPDNPEALEEEVKWEGAALQFSGYYARILDEAGRTLIETPGMDTISVSLFPPPSGVGRIPQKGIKQRSRDSRTYLLTAAWAEAGHSSGKKRLLQVVLDVSHEDTIIADYRRKLSFVLFLGIVCSAGAGIFVAGKGMQPLQEITKSVQRITSTRLHERIGTMQWPKELYSLAAAFDDMLGRLEDSFARLSQFSADLAHELRTPINNLMGEAEVALSRNRTPGEYRQVLESSLEEYDRLSSMIDSLLFLARAESAEAKIERSLFDPGREIEATLEFHNVVAEEHGVVLTRHGEALLYADPILFRRTVSNLLSNALQYTPRGGKITIHVREMNDRSVEVLVNDTGSGIEPEHLPRIFDRFYRPDRSRSQYTKGTGLGLAIVKSIMELHGGTVTVQSRPDKGTTVTLRFPSASAPRGCTKDE
ncbi:MAG: heavy metal sensor histidine kinase [Nitrospirae bacterium]|nr:heavy metal sensor histidine kinase [Nitrospirota bacterium]